MLELSRPLRFGDYGGLPLKLPWALFDLAASAVLGSGVYLRIARQRQPSVAVPLSSATDALG